MPLLAGPAMSVTAGPPSSATMPARASATDRAAMGWVRISCT